uniref:DNA-directed RNA polymerase n=1 Tax=Nelumbo nucifera TaxID=4432 RepID=A0A822XR43_NELNU|nr:TPA_asm: hypothetical protein HUJ06_021411 [Nelumbo nucifera]
MNLWVSEPDYLGKSRMLDTRMGGPFEQLVIIEMCYILKSIHQVDDKILGILVEIMCLLLKNLLEEGSRKERQQVGEMEV